jgi:uncharacterized SAM-binding protein YcdF (DUF218 family)
VIALIFAIELAIIAAWSFLAWMLDAYGRRRHPSVPFDAIIVPGCAVTSEGVPSRALARRTRLATLLMQSGHADLLVLTGGVGRFPPSEAVAAQTLAVSLGIDHGATRIEDRSTNTEENARFAAHLFDAPETMHVLVVSDGYHCFRCKRLFGRHFKQVDVAGSTPGPRLRVRGAMREVVSIARMWALSLKP